MKKTYIAPAFGIELFETEDIITASIPVAFAASPNVTADSNNLDTVDLTNATYD